MKGSCLQYVYTFTVSNYANSENRNDGNFVCLQLKRLLIVFSSCWCKHRNLYFGKMETTIVTASSWDYCNARNVLYGLQF